MGCCGKKRKLLRRGAASPEPARRGPMVSDPVSRAAPTQRSIPAPAASGAAAIPDADGGYTVVPKRGTPCPTCGTRTVLKRRYSDRLRRYFEVPWCSTCKGEPR